MAVRPANNPNESLLGRGLGTIEQAAYIARSLATETNDEASAAIDWIGPDESMTYPAFDRWLEQQGLVERCRTRMNTVYGMPAPSEPGSACRCCPAISARMTHG